LGALRLVLALSVVYGHAGLFFGFPLIPGDTAVQAFYAISGFYMALVLNEKYRPDNSSYWLFVSNRFTRLFPSYAVVLVGTLLLAFIVYRVSSLQLPFVAYWEAIPRLDVLDAVFLIGSQILMFGQDLYPFLTLQSGGLLFLPDFHADPHPLHQLLVNPPAWTLGVEFSFYLIAPFIVRRSAQTIAAVLFASLALRLFLQFAFGWHGDPWSYRFFPSELAVFLIGAIGYRVYRLQSLASDRRLLGLFVVVCAATAAALLINRWNGVSRVASVAFLLAVFLTIPMLFRFTKGNTLDRHLGELSYPVYICHFLVIWTLGAVTTSNSGMLRGLEIVTFTLLLAGALYWWVDRPLDAWRQRRLAVKQSVREVPADAPVLTPMPSPAAAYAASPFIAPSPIETSIGQHQEKS
jgi:peptidoglycan/LPS O-acetylase OafA/YrhL